ncbi:MAG: ATP-dependent sacrificial sulfur transferase LarE [Candidatus Bathyarchaeales archaeon]
MKVSKEKYETLKRYIAEKGKEGVVIAFSGGLDSSTLAAVSHIVLGDKAVAVTAKSPTYSAGELEDARKVAKEIGIKLYVIETNELANKDFSRNPENRCYYCKKELLEHLQKMAKELGFKAVFEGTNFSDLTAHRPGFKAVKEMENVYSPWVDTQFTKEEIRVLAIELGLSTHDKPPLACLASRVPYHEKITAERLERIEKAEQAVRKITGAQQLRVRDHNGLARIEVGKDERKIFCDIEVMDKIADELKRIGFKYVTLDLEGYKSGSMLRTLDSTA